ncbi:MAG: NAD-dependent epimerase/dehydratase family protein [Gammaproteobacteria bacterium]|nr:NAD-dependent epimerase/dehydratase family protein [Gammaproteobacteria bacterium]
MRRALITGGAGFIGSYVAEELLEAGYDVRLLDVLDPQVHESGVPGYLPKHVELIDADVRDRAAVDKALDGVQAVVHLAAAVGVGQSMYQLHRYVDVNSCGTAVLLEALGKRRVERLVVASSMSVYGEGAYVGPGGDAARLLHPPQRGRAQLEKRVWEVLDGDGSELAPMPTPEEITPQPSSPYALTKYDQELMCLMYGAAYSLPTVALRLFNVYGPRQALSNPYTGVMAIFACRLLNGNPPIIFEDGAQRRDFVNVRDVARAFRAALERPEADGHAINVGSGRSLAIRDVAALLAGVLGREDLEPQVAGKYRAGDIRHCFADISRAESLLGYRPQVALEDGIEELAEWLSRQTAVDRASVAAAELERRGLTL